MPCHMWPCLLLEFPALQLECDFLQCDFHVIRETFFSDHLVSVNHGEFQHTVLYVAGGWMLFE